jgi:hypothetical protein
MKPEITDEAVAAAERYGRSYLIAANGDSTFTSTIREVLEAALPAIAASFAARLEAPGSPLCDCHAGQGDVSPATSPRTGRLMAHHCDCMAVRTAAQVLGPGVLTQHERDCDGKPEPFARREDER